MLKKATLENSEKFPEPFVVAVEEIRAKKDYDFSVTEIVRPLQMIYLQQTNDYEVDAMNNVQAMMGTAFHYYMESQKTKLKDPDDYIMEQRYYKKIQGLVISGQADLYRKSNKVLWDYKTTSMYKVGKALSGNTLENSREWVIQTNCYRYMSNLECKKIMVLAIIKDFKKSNNYGLFKPAVVIELPLIKSESVEKWLDNRVKKIKDVLDTGKFPPCTDEDTWGGRRCKDWCDVNVFCKQCEEKAKNGFNYE